MNVVSNTSPLIFLSKIEALELLDICFVDVMGTVGVLKLANAKKIISKNQTIAYYDALVNQHGLYLSAKILTLLKASLI